MKRPGSKPSFPRAARRSRTGNSHRQAPAEQAAPTSSAASRHRRGVADAWSLGITTIPAVVVDQRYVVYGEPDVARAVARIEQHRRAQP
jgi:integrating conjugative element protein (TIGR03757 family)